LSQYQGADPNGCANYNLRGQDAKGYRSKHLCILYSKKQQA